MCRLAKLIPSLEEEKVYEVKQTVHFFVMVVEKGHRGISPLNLACSRTSIDSFISNFSSSLPTINLLLECGAPFDTRDNDGNTALHRAALNRPVETEVIHSLLQNGAHYDLVNNEKFTFNDLLQEKERHEITNQAARSRLEGLAAQVVSH